MTDGWLSPATVVGAWSAIAATAAALIAWRVFRWQRQADLPVVICELGNDKDAPQWLSININVRNSTGTRWRVNEVLIRSPRSARGVSQSRGPTITDNYGSFRLDWAQCEAAASNPIPVAMSVAPAGSRSAGTWSDVAWESVYLLRSSLRSRKLSMRLTLLSMDAVQRKTVIAIKRQLPDATQTISE